MNYNRFISLLCIAFWSFSLDAQDNVRTDYYFRNMNYFNTASGLRDSNFNQSIQVYGNYKFVSANPTWKSYPMISASYQGRIRGSGSLINGHYLFDNFSFYSRHQVLIGYAYDFKIKNEHSLRVGIRGAFTLYDVRKDRVNHIPTSSIKDLYFLPDLDFGLQYYWRGLHIGASGKNLIGNSIEIENENFLRGQRGFYFHTGYDFTIKNNYTLSPYTLLYFEKDFNLDLGFMVTFFQKAEVGFQFNFFELRNTYLISGYIIDRIRIGASFNHSFLQSDMNLDFLISVNF